MVVTVLLFSVLRESVGAGRLEVELAHEATGEDLLYRLAGSYPVFGEMMSSIRLARNDVYVESGVLLQDGDEVAVLTPVSGG